MISEMAGVYESVLALSNSGTVPADFVRSAQDQPGPNAFRGDSAPPEAPLPVIDMSRPECGALMADAATEWGLFQVVNHGVPGEAMAAMVAAVRRFNEGTVEAKRQYYTRDTTRKMRFYSNLDLFQSPAASWRDTVFLDMALEPPQPEELPEALRHVLTEQAN